MGSFKFIDLFAGIGGFHQAMSNLGGDCVFASEIDKYAIQTYKNNYGIDSGHDITKVQAEDIPNHDVLCAGFPCQAFSKAGKRLGFQDPTKGTLFFDIKRILKTKQPPYFILENVRNLLSHDNGNTIQVIKDELTALGYNYKIVVLSPHQLGIPQLRERVYILGVHKSVYAEELAIEIPGYNEALLDFSLIDNTVNSAYSLTKDEVLLLECWDEFYQGLQKPCSLGFPVWVTEFGADYPVDNLPKWKANFCRKTRQLYADNKLFIDSWLAKWDNLSQFPNSKQKLEWQAGDSIKSVWEGFIQFRPSGVRIKRPTTFPALVAIIQIPILGEQKRYLTPREVARLQSFPESFVIDTSDKQAYKQFGNAVNVQCVEYLAKQLFAYKKEG